MSQCQHNRLAEYCGYCLESASQKREIESKKDAEILALKAENEALKSKLAEAYSRLKITYSPRPDDSIPAPQPAPVAKPSSPSQEESRG